MTPARRLTPGLLAVLGFLAAVAPFAIHTYLASFTDIAADLGTDPARVQLTLTAFLVGIGSGQLILGPASDRWGRRPVLLSALTVFFLASAVLAFSVNIEMFIAMRFIQGFAGAAGVVIARAVAVDLSEGATAVRALSLIATVVAIAPLITAPIGGVIAAATSWRGVLVALALLTLTMLVLAWIFVPESLPSAERQGVGVGTVARRFGALFRDGGYVGYILVFGFGFGALMAYISASPFVAQIVIGMDQVTYSLAFATGAAGIILATLVNARVAPRVGPRRMLGVGLGLEVAAGVAMLTCALLEILSVPLFIACALLLTSGVGFTMSNASALALARVPQARGSGSAVLGAGQFLIGGVISPVVGLWGEDTAVPMAVIMLGMAATAVVAAALAGRARGM